MHSFKRIWFIVIIIIKPFCFQNVCVYLTTHLYVNYRSPCHSGGASDCNSLFFSARSNCSVWEGDCAAGGSGKVDGTRLLRMGPWSESGASQTLRAPRTGDQREAGGSPPLQRKHPDQRTQLQGCPKGEGTARWAPAETSIYFIYLLRLFYNSSAFLKVTAVFLISLAACVECLCICVLSPT